MPWNRFVSGFAFVATILFIQFLYAAPIDAQRANDERSRPTIPSPSTVLGFSPGTDRTIADWRQITDYFTKLDRASTRVQVQVIGESTLKRPFIVVFISAPENIRQLKKFQEIQSRLADPRNLDKATSARLIDEGKTVVAITCSIHSTEIVASQMSMQLAYDLATARDESSLEVLKNTILVLIPSVNPDGIDIVANWYRKTLGTPFEGSNPPELYHHYAGHDNNRDWFMLNLKETRLVTRLFWKEWFPQIVYDIHQQGQTGARFFTPPFLDPSNPNIQPGLIREIAVLGSKVAADLQARSFRGVITNAEYDTWWHGGLRTAPYYHNSIGILSEAASAKLMTPVRVTKEELAKAKGRGMPSALEAATNYPAPWPGGTWSPREIMAMEMIAARSVLSSAAKYRAAYLRNFYELGNAAVSGDPAIHHPLAYLIQAGQGRDDAVARLIEVLVEQGVEVHRMTRELHMKFADSSEKAVEEVPLGGYLIFLAQPARWNIQALFERQVYPDRRAPNGEAEPPYDVAGWTLPMQMGIETFPVSEIRETPGPARRLELARNLSKVRRDLGLATNTIEQSPIPNPISRPIRIGLYKSWLGSIDEGWTRWVFDNFNVPYKSLLDVEVKGGGLRTNFDVIILPSQSAKEIIAGNAPGTYPNEFLGGITTRGVENLRIFVEEGGTLICFDASTELAIKQFKLPLRNVLDGIKRSEFYCPGSILRLNVSVNDPLARGLLPQTDAYFINSSAFEATSSDRVRVIARYEEKHVLRSGWLLGEQHIAGRIALATVKLGKGRVVLFGFRPQHRGQTWGTFQFIFNAIMAE